MSVFQKNQPSALLALETGQVLHGVSAGALGTQVGELVFNTALTGYHEILTDLSYRGQLVTFTVPHVGNVGCHEADRQAKVMGASGFVVRSFSTYTQHWRSEISLSDKLKDSGTVGISGVDTRYLTQCIRESGAIKACITSEKTEEEAVALARAFPGLTGANLAQEVGTAIPYLFTEGLASKDAPHIVVVDFGVKLGILSALASRGCRVTVLPPNTTLAALLAYQPDGVLLSNGPGDPAACLDAIDCVRGLLNLNLPVFGVCLGFQLIALALGASTVKMKFGHHGANHPVQDLETRSVHITAQNHSFAVLESTLPTDIRLTHRSLFDGSLQGFRHEKKPILGFQGHPEANPGPHDALHLFDRFLALICRF